METDSVIQPCVHLLVNGDTEPCPEVHMNRRLEFFVLYSSSSETGSPRSSAPPECPMQRLADIRTAAQGCTLLHPALILAPPPPTVR